MKIRGFQKGLAFFLSVVLTLGTAAVAAGATQFNDVPGSHWASENISGASEKGIIYGRGEGVFDPNSTITRQEFLQMVDNLFKNTKNAPTVPSDANTSYRSAIGKALYMGYITADADGKVRPTEDITRVDAATVLANAFTLDGTTKNLTFYDIRGLTQAQMNAVGALKAKGIVSGFEDGSFRPQDTLTRAQAARMFDLLVVAALGKGTSTQTDVSASGNAIVVNQEGAVLENITTDSKTDVIITSGVGEGDVTFKNVTINGRLIIEGGGSNSLRFMGNTTIANILAKKNNDEPPVNLFFEKNASAGNIDAETGFFLSGEGQAENLNIKGNNVTGGIRGNMNVGNLNIGSGAQNTNINLTDGGHVGMLNNNGSGSRLNGTNMPDGETGNVDNKTAGTSTTSGTVNPSTTGSSSGSTGRNRSSSGGGSYTPAATALKNVTSSQFATKADYDTVVITLTGGTFKQGVTIDDFSFDCSCFEYEYLRACRFTRISDTVVSLTLLTLTPYEGEDCDYNTVTVKASAMATQAKSVTAAAFEMEDVELEAVTIEEGLNLVTITVTLNNGVFRADGLYPIGADDFIIDGYNIEYLEDYVFFKRVSDNVVEIQVCNAYFDDNTDYEITIKAEALVYPPTLVNTSVSYEPYIAANIEQGKCYIDGEIGTALLEAVSDNFVVLFGDATLATAATVPEGVTFVLNEYTLTIGTTGRLTVADGATLKAKDKGNIGEVVLEDGATFTQLYGGTEVNLVGNDDTTDILTLTDGTLTVDSNADGSEYTFVLDGEAIVNDVDPSLTLSTGHTFTVLGDSTLTNNGTITVEGKLVVKEDGTLVNNGVINNEGTLTLDGTMYVKGLLDNNGTIDAANGMIYGTFDANAEAFGKYKGELPVGLKVATYYLRLPDGDTELNPVDVAPVSLGTIGQIALFDQDVDGYYMIYYMVPASVRAFSIEDGSRLDTDDNPITVNAELNADGEWEFTRPYSAATAADAVKVQYWEIDTDEGGEDTLTVAMSSVSAVTDVTASEYHFNAATGTLTLMALDESIHQTEYDLYQFGVYLDLGSEILGTPGSSKFSWVYSNSLIDKGAQKGPYYANYLVDAAIPTWKAYATGDQISSPADGNTDLALWDYSTDPAFDSTSIASGRQELNIGNSDGLRTFIFSGEYEPKVVLKVDVRPAPSLRSTQGTIDTPNVDPPQDDVDENTITD